MPLNKISKKENIIFNYFLKELQQEMSLDEIYELINSIFISRLNYDIAAIYIFDNDKKFEIKNKIDKKIPLPKEIIDLKIVTDFFKEKTLRIIKKKKIQDVFLDSFNKVKKIKTAVLAPLIKNEHLYGIIWLAIKEDNKYKPDIIIVNILVQIINCTLGNFLLLDQVIEHNKELQSIAKAMRHDFANDLQSIAMVNELLLTTELNNDQARFVRLLGNANDSATEKLMKIKQLKDKFEKEIDYAIGLSLNK